MKTSITISKKYQGPPNSGNGGYVCGILGKHFQESAEITLKKPAPLDKDLFMIKDEEDKLNLWNEEDLIAVAKPATLNLDIPEPPNFETAKAAEDNYIGTANEHCFPNCFVCGPLRVKRDGLRIFAGQVNQSDVFSSTWIPSIDLVNKNNILKPEFIWSALDCPGAFAAMENSMKPMVLGKMTGQIMKPVFANQNYIVIGWKMKREGRKYFTGTAIFNDKKELHAAASSIWFEIDPSNY